jgi:hypothetical protein
LKIFIATPSYDGNYAGNYVESLLKLQQEFARTDHTLYRGHLWYESLVTRARDRMLQNALRTDCTHIVWIDGDIGFNPSDILRLCSLPEKFIVGRYPKKGDPRKPLEYVMSEPVGEPTESGLVPVRYAGTGFMIWKREVAERLVERVKLQPYQTDSRNPERFYPVFRTPIVGGVLYSEDYCVCQDWISLGEKVYMDPTVVTTHKGAYTWGA